MTRERVTFLAAGGLEDLDHTATASLPQWQCQPSAVSTIGGLAGRVLVPLTAQDHLARRDIPDSKKLRSLRPHGLRPERARDSAAVGAEDDL